MDRKDRVQKSYEVLDYLRLESGLYLASLSNDYPFVWLRDSFYEVLPYLKSDCGRYEKTYHAILDILKFYKHKFDLFIEKNFFMQGMQIIYYFPACIVYISCHNI